MDLKNKKSYSNFDPVSEIGACIDLFVCEHPRFTPTDVLRFLKYTECNEMRTLVVVIAEKKGFVCKDAGKGVTIYGIPF